MALMETMDGQTNTTTEEAAQRAADAANAALDALAGGTAGDLAPGAAVGGSAAAVAISPLQALRVIRAVMGDGRLTAAQARAVTGVILQADGATNTAWTSYRQLKRSYHLGASQIATAMELAAGVYLQEVQRGQRGAICYRILSPATVPAVGTVAAGSVPAVGTVPVASVPVVGTVDRSRSGSALPKTPSTVPATGTILTPYSKKQPPLPPEGGVCAVSLETPKTETADAAVVRIDAAHRQVFGADKPISSRWARKIATAWEDGEAWLADVDAAAIRGGMAMCKKYKLGIWGLHWVKRFIEARDCERASHAAAGATVPAADTEGEQRKAAAMEQRRRREEAEAGERMHAFLALDRETQAAYRRRVTAARFAPTRPDVIEFQAAMLAASDARQGVTA